MLLGDDVVAEYPVALWRAVAERLQRRLNHVVLEHVVAVCPHYPSAFAGQVVSFFKCHIPRGGEVVKMFPIPAERGVSIFADVTAEALCNVESRVGFECSDCADDDDIIADFLQGSNTPLDALGFVAAYQACDKANFLVHVSAGARCQKGNKKPAPCESGFDVNRDLLQAGRDADDARSVDNLLGHVLAHAEDV